MKTKQKRWEDLTQKEKVAGIVTVIVLVAVAYFGIGSLFNKGGQNSENNHVVKPTEKVNILVTSQIVKKVDGKCRYFFDVRNNDTKPYEGSVSIQLYNNEDISALGSEAFNTTKAIEPGLGNVVYLDINTCPVSMHGSTGITKYKYTVTAGNNEVNSGENAISDKFEDTDANNL